MAARVAGGVTPLDSITATPLVERNTQATADGKVQMRTDSRLLKPSLVRFTPQQVLAVLAEIQAPVLLIEGGAATHPARAGRWPPSAFGTTGR